MNALRKKLNKNSGFTLVEMLIVVAIIAILIAVSIPLVNGALERSRDATDQANERAAKAEATLVLMGVADVPSSATAGTTFDAYYKEDTGAFKKLFYNAATGELLNANTGIDKYGKCSKTLTASAGGSSTAYDKHDDVKFAATTANSNGHTNKIIAVTITNGVVTLTWE